MFQDKNFDSEDIPDGDINLPDSEQFELREQARPATGCEKSDMRTTCQRCMEGKFSDYSSSCSYGLFPFQSRNLQTRLVAG